MPCYGYNTRNDSNVLYLYNKRSDPNTIPSLIKARNFCEGSSLKANYKGQQKKERNTLKTQKAKYKKSIKNSTEYLKVHQVTSNFQQDCPQ